MYVYVCMYVKSSLHIVISGLTTQRNVGHKAWIREFNAHEICQKQRWHFIQNDSIKDSHLTNDGLHLNMSGVKETHSKLYPNYKRCTTFCSQGFSTFPCNSHSEIISCTSSIINKSHTSNSNVYVIDHITSEFYHHDELSQIVLPTNTNVVIPLQVIIFNPQIMV